MRTSLVFALVTILAACGSDKSMGGGGVDGAVSGTPAIDVQSTDITLTPGQEVTYCYYFHTSNTAPAVINKWVSDMTPGSHHLILFLGGPAHADGLDMSNSCGLGTGGISNPPIWVYSSQMSHQEMDLPADDGSGKPLGQIIQPNSEAAIQMHYLNATDQTLTAHVHVSGYALPANTPYTETDAYITYNADISIGAGLTGVTETASCNLPQGVKFWTMSTHSHKQSVMTQVMDGSSMVFQSTDWEHPGAMTWQATPFYTFTNSQLTWSCTYNNNAPPPYEPQGTSNANTTIRDGSSAATDEMCMAVGYFFPATGPYVGLWYAPPNGGSDTCASFQL